MSKETGGSAFPCEQGEMQDGRWNDTFDPGMTLRDYFAAKAMQSLLIDTRSRNEEAKMMGLSLYKYLSRASYELADNMLESRK